MSHPKDTILVAGTGPAGLFAAWACINSGYRVHFIAPFWVKPIAHAGVFVLHQRMNLPLREQDVEYFAHGGDADAYRCKVYGAAAELDVSWPVQTGGGAKPHKWIGHHYDAAHAIDLIWDILDGEHQHRRRGTHPLVATFSGGGIMARIKDWDMLMSWPEGMKLPLINTIPLDALLPPADLPMTKAWVKTGTAPADEAFIMYNANPHVPWYRASAAFGRFALEFPDGVLYPDEQLKLQQVKKVMPGAKIPEYDHNQVLLTGRYGAWDKSKLSHDAYYDTIEWLAKREA